MRYVNRGRGGGGNLTYAISFEKKLKVITQKVNIWQC